MAARGLSRVTCVVAVAPPLAFFDWEFVRALRQPLAIVVGDQDQYCPHDALDRLVTGDRVRAKVLRGADHFFGGFEDAVGRALVESLQDAWR
jgi:alpha/beta superfamily hydrolase